MSARAMLRQLAKRKAGKMCSALTPVCLSRRMTHLTVPSVLYNALPLVRSLATGNTKVSVFLHGDGVVNGVRRQSPADASYNMQEMLRMLGPNVSMGACRTCLEARGIDDQSLVEGVQRRTLDDLRDWTGEAEKVLVF